MNFLLLRSLKTVALISFASVILIACGTSQPEPDPESLTIEYLITLSEEELMDRDSDGDGLSDYDEIYIYGTDPLNPDTDGDGLSDYDEIFLYGTDPLIKDTAGNGFTDGQEVKMGTDPLDPDDPPFIRRDALQAIYFSHGESELDETAIKTLQLHTDILLTAEKFGVEIIVYTNNAETPDESDATLFDERAEFVSGYLIQNGVTKDRIEILFEAVLTDDCTDESINEFGSCSEMRRVAFRPINPYPFYPDY